VTAEPHDGAGWAQLGISLRDRGELSAAIEAHRMAVRLEPGSAWNWGHLAVSLHHARQFAEAEAAYEQALALGDDPVDRTNLGMLRLGAGDYARGWPLHEFRRRQPDFPGLTLPFPEWRGEDLGGKTLLIWPEHGFGDQIQFARYARLAKERGARVLLASPPELADLFSTLGVEVFRLTGELEMPRPDVWAPVMSLPGLFGTRLETVPPAPYLSAPEDRRAKWRGAVPPGRVGVVWKGSAGNPNDANRSLPALAAFAPLLEAGAKIIDLQDPHGDFADTAAILEQLDLVVTVDTAMAHLAGAIGAPCWVLLPWSRCDWRWGRAGDTTPWYPSLRLFRQPAFGDWDSVMAEVVRAWRAA
jgi:tetratricopeptide (TPR) repeat protein